MYRRGRIGLRSRRNAAIHASIPQHERPLRVFEMASNQMMEQILRPVLDRSARRMRAGILGIFDFDSRRPPRVHDVLYVLRRGACFAFGLGVRRRCPGAATRSFLLGHFFSHKKLFNARQSRQFIAQSALPASSRNSVFAFSSTLRRAGASLVPIRLI
jgi:hypothetical protein